MGIERAEIGGMFILFLIISKSDDNWNKEQILIRSGQPSFFFTVLASHTERTIHHMWMLSWRKV